MTALPSPRTVDVLMVAGLIAAAGVQLIHERTNALIWAGAVTAILPLLARRRWPVTVTLLATAGDLLVWSQWVHLIGDAPVALAVYGVGRYAPWPRSLVGLLGAECWVAGVLFLGDLQEPADAFGAAPVIAGVWVLGVMVRVHVRDVRQLHMVTERLRQEQRVNLQRASRDERDRLGRELHDTVSHHLTAIAVHANAARLVPAHAAAGLDRISASAVAALEEMRLLLGTMAASEPATPSLADLPSLLAEARQAGLEITAEVGDLDLPDSVQTSCYRLVQESLTNIVRHAGPTRVLVRLTRHGSGVEVLVVNEPGPGPSVRVPGAGSGLAGMRARVEVHSGTLETGEESGGGFRVRAVIP